MYAPHVTAATLPDSLLNETSLWERALLLPHDYFYVIPLAIAQCYQALGDYAQAETYYLQAAAYTYLNTQTEGPYLWVCLATLYSQWGNDVYQQGDAVTAATIYGKVITPGSTTAPGTPLYTLTGLATAAQIAETPAPGAGVAGHERRQQRGGRRRHDRIGAAPDLRQARPDQRGP